MPYEPNKKMNASEGQPRSLNIPALEGMEGFVGMYFSTILSIAAIIREPNIPDFAGRVNTMTHLVISLVPDDEKRKELRVRMDALYKTYCDEIEDIDHSQKQSCLVRASVETIGYVMQEVDRYIGLSHKNRLGFVSVNTPVREKDEQ